MAEPKTPIAGLSIQFFGPMQVRVAGQPLPPLRSRRILWLLALLTLRQNRPVEREWLAGTLWPDLDQSQAYANLRVILNGLRTALGQEGERLRSPSRHTLLLELTGADVDIHRFDAAIAGNRLSDLASAVAFYRGPLLEGCNEDWVFQERAVREQHCLQALQTLGDAALSEPDYSKAIGYYHRAVSLDPWWEEARRGWMEALAKSGDTNAALQVYREYLEVLRADPKAVPDAQTTTLYQRLRSETRLRADTQGVVTPHTIVAPVVNGYLPHPLTDLVGREDERTEVALQLRRARLVTLTGLGGIGKTRLAREVAGEVAGEYADGVWLVALEAIADGSMVAHQISSVLGLKEERGRTPLQSVTEYLRAKRLLLVLDNCEHLLEASAQVADHLLRECGEVRILATSREALGIMGETVWSVPILTVPDTEHLPQGQTTLLRVLRGYESVQLFVERAQAVQKTFDLTGSNARMVAQTCQKLEGIPLAIELAAARVRAMTVEQIASRLDDHLGLLTAGSRTAQARQQTLRATLDWSYDLLTEPERSLLRRLSVFAGGCTLEAAEQVCVGERVEESHVQNLLSSLVDKSLALFEERDPSEGRYRLLEMVRQYAAEGLQTSGEEEAVKSRHRAWCLTFAEAAEQALATAEQEVWLTRLDNDYGNLRAALDWSLKGEEENEGRRGKSLPYSPIPLLICGALLPFWSTRGYLTEGQAWCKAALKSRGAQERTVARARGLIGAGMMASIQGSYAVGRACFEECLEILRELEHPMGIAAALNCLGNVTSSLGDATAARAYYEESLSLYREIGDRQSIAICLNNLGGEERIQGDYVAARRYYDESLEIRGEIGDRLGIASTLDDLGNLACEQGDYVAARAYLEESLETRRAMGDRQGTASTLNELGNVAFHRSDDIAAHSYLEESLEIHREVGDRPGMAATLYNLGEMAYNRGDDAAGRVYHEESLTIRREIGEPMGLAASLLSLGIQKRKQGDYTAARIHYGESLALWRKTGCKPGMICFLESFAALIAVETAAATDSMETTETFQETGVGMQRAVRLWGAASALREQMGAPLPPRAREAYDHDVTAACAIVGEIAFMAGWEGGRTMTLEEAVAYALEEGKTFRTLI